MADKQAKVTDVVCGMTIDPSTAAGSSSYQGTTWYFCSMGCKKTFDANPQDCMTKGKDSTSG